MNGLLERYEKIRQHCLRYGNIHPDDTIPCHKALNSPAAHVPGIAHAMAELLDDMALYFKRLPAEPRGDEARLRAICAAAYQMAGVLDAPVRFLDALALHDEYMQMEPDAIIEKLLPIHAEPSGDGFLIFRTEGSWDQAMWWRPNRRGYTFNIKDAGVYSAADAAQIEADSRGEDYGVPQSSLQALPISSMVDANEVKAWRKACLALTKAERQ